jgi:hypothetical protein
MDATFLMPFLAGWAGGWLSLYALYLYTKAVGYQ